MSILGALLLAAQALEAEELRLGGPGGWSEWTLPGDAVDVADGVLKPAFVRQNIDAVQNAATFGGGIRDAGTALNRAALLIDGDVETAWAPAAEAPLEDWWIEVDLGRVVSARTIRLRFAEDGEPLEFFKVFTSDGEPFFTNAGVAIEGTLRYNKRRRYSFSQDRVIEIDFGLKPLQHIRIQADKKTPGAQLSELSVKSVGDNLSLGAQERGGQIDVHSLVGSGRDERYENPLISRNLIDGDITSYWGRKEGRGVTPMGLFILDLGVLFWVDRVRLLGDFTGLPTTGERARTRFGSINYLWYKMSGSDGSLAPDGSLRWVSLGELPESLRNRRDIVHFEERFPSTKLRYVRLLFGMTSGALSGTTAEFQVFGEGFPAALTALSPIFDLGGKKTISALDWQSQVPPDTRLEIRSRTGNLLDEEYSFFDKNGKEVSARKYDKLIPSFRGRIDTVRTIGSDWSNWSPAYEVWTAAVRPNRGAALERRPVQRPSTRNADLALPSAAGATDAGGNLPSRGRAGRAAKFHLFSPLYRDFGQPGIRPNPAEFVGRGALQNLAHQWGRNRGPNRGAGRRHPARPRPRRAALGAFGDRFREYALPQPDSF
ncbi:MAG: discoidin domain-containing protein [Candidatus Latescibacteria bacterium]|nr:discoidin domain-containing protein [Candidatus Latescibacterota bacterium]